MFNTYGIFSINQTSFENDFYKRIIMPPKIRSNLISLLKINNLVFNSLGYFKSLSYYSGISRILISYFAIFIPQSIENDFINSLIKPWEHETHKTFIFQIIRGCTEAFIPCSLQINLIMDVVSSFFNFSKRRCSNDLCDNINLVYLNIPIKKIKTLLNFA